MDPIFEIAVSGRVREVRVGGEVYPTFTPYEFLGRSCSPATLVEAPKAVGELHGWTRRLDVELARKLRYQEMGAMAAAMMREADAEGAAKLATDEAMRSAAAERAEHEDVARREAERIAVEDSARAAADRQAAAVDEAQATESTVGPDETAPTAPREEPQANPPVQPAGGRRRNRG